MNEPLEETGVSMLYGSYALSYKKKNFNVWGGPFVYVLPLLVNG